MMHRVVRTGCPLLCYQWHQGAVALKHRSARTGSELWCMPPAALQTATRSSLGKELRWGAGFAIRPRQKADYKQCLLLFLKGTVMVLGKTWVSEMFTVLRLLLFPSLCVCIPPSLSAVSMHYFCNQKKMLKKCHLLKTRSQTPPSGTQWGTPVRRAVSALSLISGSDPKAVQRPTLEVPVLRTLGLAQMARAGRQFECHLVRGQVVTFPYKAKDLIWSHTPDPFFLKKAHTSPPPAARVLPPGGEPLVPPGWGVLLWDVVTVSTDLYRGFLGTSHRRCLTGCGMLVFEFAPATSRLCFATFLWITGR